ncbi:MAG: hypothetical protein KF749_14460 [Bacteroidetes bacterium]|nr:hypothetical protein [Bacteroidota bacterium]MCW5895705.1 hypothetical protein [Bacteroidota bacterium]
MKFLVASIGNRLESYVAKRFEHAAWYLIVDSETEAIEAIRHNTPHDRRATLLKAASAEVQCVVAGKFGDSALKLIRTHDMRIAPVHGINAKSALEMIEMREIELVDVHGMRKHRTPLTGMMQKIIPGRTIGKNLIAASCNSSDSQRGHHHLQQYGGRGH